MGSFDIYLVQFYFPAVSELLILIAHVTIRSLTKDPPQSPEDFESKQDAIKWVLDACALRHKEARTEKSDKTRAYFRCTKTGCEFCFNLNKGGDGIFRVSKLV